MLEKLKKFVINLKKHKILYLVCLLFSILIIIFNDFVLNNITTIFSINTFNQKFLFLLSFICSILLLNFIILFIYYLIKNRDKYKIFNKYLILYFGIMLIFLIALWPGIFKGDEYYLLDKILNLHPCIT